MLIKIPFEFRGNIYRSPMPFSNFDSAHVWNSYQDKDINLVLVLTEQQEYLVYARMDLPEFYRGNGLDVLHVPVPDFGVPTDLQSWENGIDKVTGAAQNGKNVAVHCLAGIGRTGTFLACIAKEVLGFEGREAIRWVRESLPGAIENRYQEDFVIGFER